jgi:O-antigen ligase
MYQGRNVLERLGHQGGVHNSYLAFWLNTGITGLFLLFRGIALVFIKATKNTAVSMAILFSVLFSILYESWLAGSLNPYTILFLVILTIISEEEIIGELSAEEPPSPVGAAATPTPLVLPAR